MPSEAKSPASNTDILALGKQVHRAYHPKFFASYHAYLPNVTPSRVDGPSRSTVRIAHVDSHALNPRMALPGWSHGFLCHGEARRSGCVWSDAGASIPWVTPMRIRRVGRGA